MAARGALPLFCVYVPPFLQPDLSGERNSASALYQGKGAVLLRRYGLFGDEDLADFCARAKAQAAGQSEFLTAGPWDEDQLVYFSCLPWFPLTAVTNERDVNPSDTIPRVTWGRWVERDGQTMLSLSMELNHRLLDGYHVGQFYAALNARMEAL